MKSLSIRNGTFQNCHQWELNTRALANIYSKVVTLPSFFFFIHQKQIKCCIRIVTSTGHSETRFDVNIEVQDDNKLEMDYLSLAFLSSRSKRILSVGPVKLHVNGKKTYTLWQALKADDLKELKYKHGRLFLNLYFTTYPKYSSECSTWLNANFYRNDEYCCEFTSSVAKCLMEENLFSDAVFVSRSKEFRIHKSIFGARSSYFGAIFSHESIEKQSSRVLIKNKNGELVEDSVVEELIRYVYTGTVKNMDKVSLELFKLADMYNLMDLRQTCAEYLNVNASSENTVSLLKIAKQFDMTETKAAVFYFMKRQQTFIIECLFSISPKLWSCELTREIESNALKTKGRDGISREIRFKLKNVSDGFYFGVEILSPRSDGFPATLVFGLSNSFGKPYYGFVTMSVPSEVTSVIYFPSPIFYKTNLKQLLYKNDEIFFSVFVLNQSAENERSLNSVYSLKTNQSGEKGLHVCNFSKDLRSFYNNEAFSDFKIKTKDREFFVHKSILAANVSRSSSKFDNLEQMFDGEYLFIDMESEVVEVMLRFIYGGGGFTDKFSKYFAELYILAEDYGFERLRDGCLLHLR